MHGTVALHVRACLAVYVCGLRAGEGGRGHGKRCVLLLPEAVQSVQRWYIGCWGVATTDGVRAAAFEEGAACARGFGTAVGGERCVGLCCAARENVEG